VYKDSYVTVKSRKSIGAAVEKVGAIVETVEGTVKYSTNRWDWDNGSCTNKKY